MIRFSYSSHKTYAAAEAALEDYFATGEVSWGDNPDIVKRGKRWHVELNG